MIEKVAKIKLMKDKTFVKDDLEYWLSKTPEERVSAVDYLRMQCHGSTERLQRVVGIIQRPQS